MCTYAHVRCAYMVRIYWNPGAAPAARKPWVRPAVAWKRVWVASGGMDRPRRGGTDRETVRQIGVVRCGALGRRVSPLSAIHRTNERSVGLNQ